MSFNPQVDVHPYFINDLVRLIGDGQILEAATLADEQYQAASDAAHKSHSKNSRDDDDDGVVLLPSAEYRALKNYPVFNTSVSKPTTAPKTIQQEATPDDTDTPTEHDDPFSIVD